jgi:nitrite reductase/ring-hydroxylating ferredoxin subunit
MRHEVTSKLRIMRRDERTPHGIHAARVAGVDLVVLDDDEVRVFEGTCPHQGTLLAEGALEHSVLVCRGHGWRFDCRSGRALDQPNVCLRRFATEVREGDVFVDAAEVEAYKRGRDIAAAPARALPATMSDLPGPKGVPLLGNVLDLDLANLPLVLEGWCRQFGPVYRFEMLRRPTRLKPATPLLFFEPKQDVELDGLRIPRGAPIFLLTRFACIEDGQAFEGAREFRPQRWLQDGRSPAPGRTAFAPFGAGPRLCPGRNLALLEMKMALATVCRHFGVAAVGPGEVREHFEFVLTPKDLRVELRAR